MHAAGTNSPHSQLSQQGVWGKTRAIGDSEDSHTPWCSTTFFFLLTGQWSKGERQAYWEPHNTNPTTAPILNTVCLLASHRVTIYSLKPDHVIVNSTFHTHVVVGCLPLPINKRYSLPFKTKQNQKTWQVTQFALQSISGNDKSEINLNSYQASKSETGLNKQD